MKTILGLDLGTNSIGWALVKEAENSNEKSEIIKLGVRVNPLTVDEKTNFEAGKPLSTNADRTAKRSVRRNLQRYKLRRKDLIDLLIKNQLIDKDTPLTEIGKNTTHQTLELRAKAARERIELEDLARVFLAINKKRGYRSSRKVNNEEEGQAVDGMAVAKKLYDENLTPGQYAYELLSKGKKYVPDFYRSDLQAEFDSIWEYQKQFYADILDDELYNALKGQGQQNSRKRFLAIKGVYTAENKGKRDEVKLQHYKWRSEAISKKINIGEVAYVLVEINNDLNKSSGYLGAISDRSKELYFNKETVGENLWKQIQKNPHTSLKNQVFYRQDYLDEFEQIWETQAQFHPQLTLALKEQIRDVIIFYQRKLKSQKGLLSFCQFESWEIERKDENGNVILNKTTKLPKKQTVGRRVAPKSSPLFQEFKIWQNINDLEVTKISEGASKNKKETETLSDDERKLLFEELNLRGNLSQKEVLQILGLKDKEYKTNFPEGLEGNRTNAALFNIYQQIAENEGYGFDWSKKSAQEIKKELRAVFPQIGIQADILDFNANLDGKEFENQASYQLWHLLYSAEEDDKISEEDQIIYGNSAVSLKKKLCEKFGFTPEYAKWIANVALQDDYGNLSTKAMRKIIPYLIDGNDYSEACALAGYNHSNSLTKEENDNRELLDKLELLPKNSLRNPVVEKILNQMVNVVNQVIEIYGKPDEVRIELARELKKSAEERAEMTKGINEATRRNEDIKKRITKDFGISNPTKSDVVRYRLWEELAPLAYKDVFTGKQIKKEDLFSSKIDIEHIIPKALLFDDSFSNKTLAFRQTNLKKGDRTAYDFIESDYNATLDNYIQRVETLYNNAKGTISKGKRNKLLMAQKNLPDGFIERDLRNSQYIAKKAKMMLYQVFKDVNVTSGSITDRLREDWDLINVMKELNFPKYKALGLTEIEERYDIGQEKIKRVEVITDWTKRNDHRHHAMDALTVAFTTKSHVQYLNNLNTIHSLKGDEIDLELSKLYGLKNTITEMVNKKRKFIPPMPNFREEAKKHIETILVSIKNKNKVYTKNINKTKKKSGHNTKEQLTPRGQLHKETVYGKSKRPMNKPTKINKNFSLEQAQLIINVQEKELVLRHLAQFDNNPAVAFDTKTLKKMPLLKNGEPLKEVLCFEEIFTIRKEIVGSNPSSKQIVPDAKSINKIIDKNIQSILKKRLSDFGGNTKEAFSDLDKNPIWLNKEKGICIKRVTITGVSNAEALHHQKDHLGREILDDNGNPIPADFVSTGNNHHLAVYLDSEGKLQDNIVSFYEAVVRTSQGLPVVDKGLNKDLGWKFLFSLKQNEMFVFPNDDFDINDFDLLDDNNAELISKHLYRVQAISKVPVGNSFARDIIFRHHIETTVERKKELKDISYIQLKSLEGLRNIKKVRINHIGKIVQVGEY
ncbi:type II CRISPR RNA-guided endonuclease Cas9 [Riemerella anatipestifer]|uniref:type II CRISPR RNA-guided endonuclease Cas9 n=1 Tax=Riemerella anatipestifer TaxID=34085 RepID=UPI001AD74B15|nr:type II CRISPR RNA-guided endonuclease Cas9 [Riemerella anatipestifer]MBO4233785.1 type II CRISPR RNA-guided endonuclease Cas9 [Riemerella anatipestifer]